MKKTISYITLTIVIVGIAVAAYGYSIINTGFDIKKTTYIYIDERKDYNILLKELKDSAKIESISSFEILASTMGYKGNLRTGRYAVTPDMNILTFIRNLRSGHQAPINITFNNIRTKEDFSERISNQLMIDEEKLLSTLKNPEKCNTFGFTTETIIAMFIPNTYQFYWDISLDSFLQRMNKEYNKYWNEDRLAKAKTINLSSIEVSTLASIVEEECTYTDEYPIVAGLYLNRLQLGQALQADPTVKFAVGDFSLRRILNKHLEIDSPYNTYKYSGLPPGPIRMPSIKGLEAVLNHATHDYLYMCAKEDFSGRHNFAKTFSEHQRNASLYRNELNKRGIK
ncbi:endolytic transglycosylase MltG [Dysgonomonas sp. Marseille-P4677]|uniref:endolytic transglycosylase MltG n=1 Tax=Dysgonomonas sp. Marseille-P4677 TaxID=2364790 RepID=UPI0019135FBB|nr:endolytic transglycosylase MltG [Dysgonomonas sp. Marseille-P4677]MBK5720839.1 endolytic transglycosylase MltG [Dysgonomonas sp. Marseille-P4677]